MEFDLKKFETTNFKDRTKDVPITNPELKKFFKKKKGEKKAGGTVWVIRGLSGIESAIAKQAVNDNQMELIKKVSEAINSRLPKDIEDVLSVLVGLDKDSIPNEELLRYGWLEYGSVNPKLSRSQVVKFANNFHEEFLIITNEIGVLSGKGRLGE